MGKPKWTEVEQMKVVWSIVDTQLIQKTKKKTSERKQLIDLIMTKLKNDPDFSGRLIANDPEETIRQHIREWIKYLDGNGKKPPLVR